VRNLIRTQSELYSAFQTLQSNREFKALLKRRPAEECHEFERKFKALNSNELLKEVRNDVGGHVRHKAVQRALNRISDEAFGFFQVGDSAMQTEYGFASQIVIAMLMKGVTKREVLRGIGSRKFRQLRAYLVLAHLADACFVMYALDRGIAPF
jgi:hypothetical protein